MGQRFARCVWQDVLERFATTGPWIPRMLLRSGLASFMRNSHTWSDTGDPDCYLRHVAYNTDWWTGDFTDAQVKLNTYYTRNESDSEIQGVAAHELGHAMGLAHVTFCALMYPDTPRCGISTPTSDDVNGINTLY